MPDATAPARSPLHPLRALLHPLWWAALLLMAANDHLFKPDPRLGGLVTGKLSDVTGLLVAPVVLAAVLQLRTRRAVLAAHVAIGAWFAAMNLSVPFAQAFAALTALGPLPPWRPVVDAPDLLALPMLFVSWRVLVPAMQPVATDARRLPWRRALQLAALACSSVFLLGNEEGGGPSNFSFPLSGVTIAIGNATPDRRIVRIRPLCKDVALDCTAIATGPDNLLSRKLFAPAQVFHVQAQEVVDFATQTDDTTRNCHAFLIDGPGLPLRLLFWQSADFLPTTVNSQLGTDRSRVVVITASASGALGWSPHKVSLPPPAVLDATPVSTCVFPDVEGALAWSAPVPLGNAVSLTAVQESPDGCLALDVVVPYTPVRWFLCVPVAAFPFEPGAKLSITVADKDYAFGPLDGVKLSDGTRSLTVGRGTSVPYFGKGTAAMQLSKGCGGRYDSCGGLSQRMDVVLSGIPNQETKTLIVGQAALVGPGKTLHLVRALNRVSVDGKCPDELQNTANSGSPVLGPMVEAVLVEEP